MSLLRRAVILNDATWTLQLPYTYKIVNPGLEKAKAREQIGKMASDVLDVIAEDLLMAGFSRYLQYLGYNLDQTKRILNGPTMDSIQIGTINNQDGSAKIQGSTKI